MVELPENGDVVFGVEAQIDCIVNGTDDDIVRAVVERGIASTGIPNLEEGHIDACGGEYAELVGN